MDQTTRQAVYEAARAYAFDRYLSALLCPREMRDDLVVWAAFVGEIERIPFVVSEPMLGEIRLQWWRDWLDGLGAEGVSGNPVADAMAGMIRQHDLDHAPIAGLIETRVMDLYADPVEDWSCLGNYLRTTEGVSFEVAARIAGVEVEPDLHDAAREAGTAYGVCRLLHRLPSFARHGRWPLPVAVDAAGGDGPVDMLGRDASDLRQRISGEAVEHSRKALDALRTRLKTGLPGLIRAFLPAALVEPYLRGFDKVGFDPLTNTSDIAPLERVWRLWRASTTGRI